MWCHDHRVMHVHGINTFITGISNVDIATQIAEQLNKRRVFSEKSITVWLAPVTVGHKVAVEHHDLAQCSRV